MKVIDITRTCTDREKARKWLQSTEEKESVALSIERTSQTDWLFYDESVERIYFHRKLVWTDSSAKEFTFICSKHITLAEFYIENTIHLYYTRADAKLCYHIYLDHCISSREAMSNTECRSDKQVLSGLDESFLLKTLEKRLGKHTAEVTDERCLEKLTAIVIRHNGTLTSQLNRILRSRGWNGKKFTRNFYIESLVQDLRNLQKCCQKSSSQAEESVHSSKRMLALVKRLVNTSYLWLVKLGESLFELQQYAMRWATDDWFVFDKAEEEEQKSRRLDPNKKTLLWTNSKNVEFKTCGYFCRIPSTCGCEKCRIPVKIYVDNIDHAYRWKDYYCEKHGDNDVKVGTCSLAKVDGKWLTENGDIVDTFYPEPRW